MASDKTLYELGELTELGLDVAIAMETKPISEVAKEFGLRNTNQAYEAFKLAHDGKRVTEWRAENGVEVPWASATRDLTRALTVNGKLTELGRKVALEMETRPLTEIADELDLRPTDRIIGGYNAFKLAHNGLGVTEWRDQQEGQEATRSRPITPEHVAEVVSEAKTQGTDEPEVQNETNTPTDDSRDLVINVTPAAVIAGAILTATGVLLGFALGKRR